MISYLPEPQTTIPYSKPQNYLFGVEKQHIVFESPFTHQSLMLLLFLMTLGKLILSRTEESIVDTIKTKQFKLKIMKQKYKTTNKV